MKLAKFYDYGIASPIIQAPEESRDKVKFIDSVLNGGSGVVVKVIAQHAARKTRNNALYLPSKIVAAAGSMISRANGGTSAYGKPVLKNHDYGEPGFLGGSSEGSVLGRAVRNSFVQYDLNPNKYTESVRRSLSTFLDAKNDKPTSHYVHLISELDTLGIIQDKSWMGTGHLAVEALIVDPNAVERVLDGRYVTVSTGMTSDAAICSVKGCHADWVQDDICEHRPGHDGMFLIAGNLNYEEAFSFVVNPGDEEAVVADMQVVQLPNGSMITAHDNKTESPYELNFTLNDSYKETPMTIESVLTESIKDPEQLKLITDALLEAKEVKSLYEEARKLHEEATKELTEAKAQADKVNTSLAEQKDLVKFLRLELRENSNELNTIGTERNSYASRLHAALATTVALCDAITTNGKIDQLFLDAQSKTVEELENKIKILHDQKFFDNIVLQPALSDNKEKIVVENPTLSHTSGLASDNIDNEVKTYIDRYKHLKELHGETMAKEYWTKMKRSGFIPRNFKLEDIKSDIE